MADMVDYEISIWGPRWLVPDTIPLCREMVIWMNGEGFAAEETDGELIRGTKPPKDEQRNFFDRLYRMFLKETGVNESQSIVYKEKMRKVICLRSTTSGKKNSAS